MKPTIHQQMIDDTNLHVTVYGRTEAAEPDVAVSSFAYNNQTGRAELRMSPREIAANGDEVRRQFSDNGKLVDHDEYLLDLIPTLAKHYNGRKHTKIILDYGGGNDAPDARVEQLITAIQALRAKNPGLSWKAASQQAYAEMEPGVIRSLKKHGYDLNKLEITIMPEGPNEHASLRIVTGEQPRAHNTLTLMVQTLKLLVTGPFRKPGMLKRIGSPDPKNVVIGVDGSAMIESKYTKASKKLTETGRLITLTAQAKGKRKAIAVAGILVDTASIDIGPLNNIVVDDVSGRQTALVVNGMPYEQVALREGLAAYKGKTKPIIRQVIAGALPDQVTQRAEALFASLPPPQKNNEGYRRALARAVFEHVPIAGDLASIGYDITNLEVLPRGDGYMLLQFAP